MTCVRVSKCVGTGAYVIDLLLLLYTCLISGLMFKRCVRARMKNTIQGGVDTFSSHLLILSLCWLHYIIVSSPFPFYRTFSPCCHSCVVFPCPVLVCRGVSVYPSLSSRIALRVVTRSRSRVCMRCFDKRHSPPIPPFPTFSNLFFTLHSSHLNTPVRIPLQTSRSPRVSSTSECVCFKKATSCAWLCAFCFWVLFLFG